MRTSKAVKAPVTSPGSRDASGRSRKPGSQKPARVVEASRAPAGRPARSGELSRIEPTASRAVRAGMSPKRAAKTTGSRDASATGRSDKKTSATARVGFVCPPCGRFIPTVVDGVVLRAGRGSPPRFCSPGCRQAAYRRRQAGVTEDVPLQPGGGRDRSLKSSGSKAARSGRRSRYA